MSADLSTTYLGLKLQNPLVVAACPLTLQIEWLERLEQAGAGAAVIASLFEEQIEHEEAELLAACEYGSEFYAEHSHWYPDPGEYRSGTATYLDHITAAKKAVSMPIIASLNGTSTGGWVKYAKMMQDAGADALELNVYFIAADVDAPAADVEKRYTDLVAAVKQSISIPLAVKVGPYFSSPGNMCLKLAEAGADGLVVFNRFLQPDIDIKSLETSPHLELSAPQEMLLPLRWVAILRGRVSASLAVTGGVHDGAGLAKVLLAGADVAQVASTIYLNGFEHISRMIRDLTAWMLEKEYDSVDQLRGSMSQQNCPQPAAFERGNYMKALTNFTGKPV
ncbi:MAG: dihydroorotate dehydrogenase-like protein [Thermoguttaceae bacterium]|jgi:dihydroorotate dehydrogenase (fumarate)|nr:dihydroorotate dehydrogenase-like protein [Thermoguttaceae bacterium]